MATKLQPGDEAPDLSLPDQDGKPAPLARFRGRKVVVDFCPKDGTTG